MVLGRCFTFGHLDPRGHRAQSTPTARSGPSESLEPKEGEPRQPNKAY